MGLSGSPPVAPARFLLASTSPVTASYIAATTFTAHCRSKVESVGILSFGSGRASTETGPVQCAVKSLTCLRWYQVLMAMVSPFNTATPLFMLLMGLWFWQAYMG